MGFEDLFNEFPQAPKEPSASEREMQQSNDVIKQIYDGFVRAGFTEQQSITLVAELLKETLRLEFNRKKD